MSSTTLALRLPAFGEGKPSKRKDRPPIPAAQIKAAKAEGPGKGLTECPFSRARHARTAPGSESPGVPASLQYIIFLFFFNAATLLGMHPPCPLDGDGDTDLILPTLIEKYNNFCNASKSFLKKDKYSLPVGKYKEILARAATLQTDVQSLPITENDNIKVVLLKKIDANLLLIEKHFNGMDIDQSNQICMIFQLPTGAPIIIPIPATVYHLLNNFA